MDGNFPRSRNPTDQVDKLFFSFVGKMKIQAKTQSFQISTRHEIC